MRILLIGTIIIIAACTSAPEYDLIISNGKIYDGSGNPPIDADVAVSADTIAAIGDLADATANSASAASDVIGFSHRMALTFWELAIRIIVSAWKTPQVQMMTISSSSFCSMSSKSRY